MAPGLAHHGDEKSGSEWIHCDSGRTVQIQRLSGVLVDAESRGRGFSQSYHLVRCLSSPRDERGAEHGKTGDHVTQGSQRMSDDRHGMLQKEMNRRDTAAAVVLIEVAIANAFDQTTVQERLMCQNERRMTSHMQRRMIAE